MHDVTSATAKILQLEQKCLPYGTRPFLLLRRVWLARLGLTGPDLCIRIKLDFCAHKSLMLQKKLIIMRTIHFYPSPTCSVRKDTVVDVCVSYPVYV